MTEYIGVKECWEMIEECSNGEPLTEWEYDFVDSVAVQLRKGSTLSDKQREKLEQIHRRVAVEK